jgi:cell division transport system permease protein
MFNAAQNYLSRHARNCVSALGRISRQPLASCLTVAVIGIALAMPMTLNVIVKNGQSIAGDWEDIRDFSVYLSPGTAIDAAVELRNQLERLAAIESVRLIPADDALKEFESDAMFSEFIAALDDNPLPHTIVIRPAANESSESLAALEKDLLGRANVDLVKLDTEWVRRLTAFLDLARRGVIIASILLVGAVIVIIGNTIRLDIQNRRAEIEVSKLLGASDAFVRQPFLYSGFWYGALGAIFALFLLSISLVLLSGPIERLSSLYGSRFELSGVDGATALTIVLGGLLTGLGGAWMAVARHLSDIQPKVN